MTHRRKVAGVFLLVSAWCVLAAARGLAAEAAAPPGGGTDDVIAEAADRAPWKAL